MSNTRDSSEASFFWLEIWDWLRTRKWTWTKGVWILLLTLTLFRFWYCTSLELVADEAYYWLWSNNLDICYYSKGPGIAWTIATGTFLFGDTVFGIRFFAVLLSAGTGYWLFRLGKSLFDAPTGFLSLCLAAVLPLYAVGSILMTIDPLSLFFWTLAACAFWKAIETDRWTTWVWPGLWIGMGMLCKYTNIAQLIAFGLFCLWSTPHRRHLLRPTFWTMVAVSLISLLPPIIWNAKNDWITLQHLIDRGKLGSDDTFTFKFGELTQFISEQALVISPLLFIAIFVAAGTVLYKCFRPARPDQAPMETPRSELPARSETSIAPWKFLLCLFLPLPLFYLLLSINEAGEANWTAPAYLAGTVLLAAFLRFRTRPAGIWRRLGIAAVCLALLQTVIMHNTAWIPFHQWGIKDPMDRVRGHQQLAREVAELQHTLGASFIVARRYQTAALLSFYHPDRPQIYIQQSHRIENQFSFWAGYDEMMTHELSALFVCRGEEGPRPSFQAEFSSVELRKEFTTRFRNRPMEMYRIYFCSNYHGGETFPAGETPPIASPFPQSTEEELIPDSND